MRSNWRCEPSIIASSSVLSVQRMALKVRMDEIMCMSVITIISLCSKNGSAQAEGGGQVIDGLGSALSSIVLFTCLIVAHSGRRGYFH